MKDLALPLAAAALLLLAVGSPVVRPVDVNLSCQVQTEAEGRAERSTSVPEACDPSEVWAFPLSNTRPAPEFDTLDDCDAYANDLKAYSSIAQGHDCYCRPSRG